VADGGEVEAARQLAREARGLPVDYVLMDLASGTGAGVLELFFAADLGALMVSPDPASVELGYRFVRAAFARRLEAAGLAQELSLDREALRRFTSGVGAPRDVYERAQARDPELAARIEAEMLALRPRLVVNHVRSKADMDFGKALASAARRRMGLPITHLGHLEYDDAAWVSLRRRRPLLVEHPESRASKCIEKLARRLLARETEKHFESIAVGDSHYDLFEIEPTASEEDIRRAHRRIRSIYGRDSIIVGGLYSPEQLEALHGRFDDGYETLMDPAKRKAYDQALFPEGLPQATGAAATLEATAVAEAPPPEERPPMPEIGPETEFTGPLMRQVREARGLDLREISERTKIGMTYLSAIEKERFHKLPATVYVRGFLEQYAKMLGLERDRVLESYLRRYRDARDAKESVQP
jgi:flagellar biosynthesis protein FlhG